MNGVSMGLFVLNTAGSILVLVLLAAGAMVVFARVRAVYQSRGVLSRPVAILQTGYFLVYALSSYLLLDSRLSHINVRSGWLTLAILLMIIGFLMVVFSMPFLGKQSFGYEVVLAALRQAGQPQRRCHPCGAKPALPLQVVCRRLRVHRPIHRDHRAPFRNGAMG